MSVSTHTRNASINEIAAELDRRGAVIEALEAERNAYRDALENIDSVAVDFGFYESAALTMQDHARKALSSAPDVKSKPFISPNRLEWTPWTGSASYAYSPIGDYSVDRDEDEDMSNNPFVTWGSDENLGHHPTLEDAQAAAQADYDNRVLAVLPGGQVTDVNEALLKAASNAAATISAIYQWLERAEKAGGATSISGLAECNAMLKSLRKNADRTENLVMAPLRDVLSKATT